MRKMIVLVFLVILTAYSKDCFFDIKSEKKKIKIEKNDNRCVTSFFRKINGFDITYCIEDIKVECDQHRNELSIDKCPLTIEELYAFLDFEYSNDILFFLAEKGKLSIKKNENNISEIFEAKYKMLCNISGMSGGEYGMGLFVSNDKLLNKRVEGYIW